jgi:hypothetical protein
MKTKKVLKQSNLPSKLPIGQTLLTILALDYWNAPQWLWGAFGLLFVIAWVGSIYSLCTEKGVDLLENDK